MIVLLFNDILFLVTPLSMHSAVTQIRTAAVIQYSSFMNMYEFVTTIEFTLLMFIVPAATASSTSGERERQTLESMPITQMTVLQVVIGKLVSVFSTLLLPTVSSFPAIAMVFVCGGITWGDTVSLFSCYITVAFFAGSVGLYFSALFERSTVSTMVTYGVLVAVVAGTYFISELTLSPPSMNINNSVTAYGSGENAVRATSGGASYLLLLNPVTTFLTILNDQVEGSAPLTKIRSYFDMMTTNFIADNWTMVSILIQLAPTILMIYIAVRCTEPIKRKRRNGKKGVDHGDYQSSYIRNEGSSGRPMTRGCGT